MISFLLPTRGRVEKLKEVIASCAATVSHPENIEMIIRVDDDDPGDYSFPLPPFCRLVKGPRPATKVEVYNEIWPLAKGDIMMPLGDDAPFMSHGWDEIIEAEFAAVPDKILMLYSQDGINNEKFAQFTALSRRWVEALGYLASPLYAAFFGDNHQEDVARRIGRIKYCPDIVFDHQAAHVGKAEKDDTFNTAIPHFQADKKIYDGAAKVIAHDAAILEALKEPHPGFPDIRLAIGIPCNFQMVPLAFFESLMLMERPNFELIMKDAGHIDDMRNDIVKTAQKAGCTHLIMMDTDMIYHPQTITRLLSHDLPIVGALTFRRYPPFDPLMMKSAGAKYQTIQEWKDGDLVEVDATGTGCLMLNMRIFDELPYPWFRMRTNEEGGVIGEDIGLCKDLKERGYQIFVDTSVPSSHLTTMAVNLQTHLLYKAKAAARLRQAQKQGGQGNGS